jgi:hypothetical protein
MEDSKNTRNSSGLYAPAAVKHISLNAKTGAMSPWWHDQSHLVTPINTPPRLDAAEMANMFPELDGGIVSALAGEAFTAFADQFPSQTSIANFVFELREIASLLPRLASSLSRTIASGYLNLEFGWKPLIKDIKTLALTCSRVEDRLAWLRKHYGEWVDLGFYRKNIQEIGSVQWAVSSAYSWAWDYKIVDYSSEFRARGYLLQRLRDLDSTLTLVRAFMSALGLNNPLKVVWNALPYSFVIDWFGKVSTHLDRLGKVQDVSSQWQVERTCMSYTQTCKFEVRSVNLSWDGSVVNPTQLLGTVNLRRYIRVPGLPVSLDIFSLNNLNPKQLALTMALLAK